MSRILVIGGYGGFGARLTRRLLARGHRVIVAGRSIEKAVAFCAGLEGAEPIAADRTNGIGMAIARERPDLVLDAAGPFQDCGYTVPEACIAMRIPYLDLADARQFVMGICALDVAAKAAGVAIISGASSVPALSGAVVRELARGLARVDRIDMAISASNRAVAGPAVATAILSYVGRPIRLWRGERWGQGIGWQELRRIRFSVSGQRSMKRWVALADVPDVETLPPTLPGHPAVNFRAGTELGFQMIALWLASWPVRWGWIASLRRAATWLHPLQRLTAWAGSDRSAMIVTLSAPAIERSWTLIASKGDGPHIPTLAAELLAEAILAGRIAPGARHAGGLLSLDQFEPLFAALSIRHEIRERPSTPLYARVMGKHFDDLPVAVREMHQVYGDAGAMGEGTVERGGNLLARLIGAVMRFPPEGTYPLHVGFAERDGCERWTRDFGGHRFSSELRERGDCVVERFGPIRLAFSLPSNASGLEMVLRRWSVLGIRLPRLLAPRIRAREWQEDGLFFFQVAAALPWVGAIVRYSGWLRRTETGVATPPGAEAAPATQGMVQA